MPVTLAPSINGTQGHDMGRTKKPPTHPIRVYKDTADDLHRIAGALGLDVADMVVESLRALADSRREEAARNVLNKKAKAARQHAEKGASSPR